MNYYAPYANVWDLRTVLEEGTNGHNGIELGVKVDVFPIDGVSSNIDEYHTEKEMFAEYWSKMYVKRVKLPLLWKRNKMVALSSFIRKLRLLNESYASLQKQVRTLITNHPYEEAKFVDLRCYPWPKDSQLLKEVFDEYEDVPFENIKVSIIKRYDEYLTRSYGDYMTFPPEEKRIPHHHFKAYWKN